MTKTAQLLRQVRAGRPEAREALHDRAHFLALAATAMRQVLIDHFRLRQAAKRGGGVEVATLETFHGAPLQDRGSTVMAEALGVSKRTVSREWRQARAWLARELAA